MLTTAMTPPVAVFLPEYPLYGTTYGPVQREQIARRTQLQPVILDAVNWREHLDVCARTELIFASWGMPRMDAEFLRCFPVLRAVFYAAGSVKCFTTDESWTRDIPITSAYAANAVPVAEFTVAQIVLAAKNAWPMSRRMWEARAYPSRDSVPGLFGVTVGLISLGAIGRLVAERLRAFDVNVLAYDPFLSPDAATALGITLVALDELFARSLVVSCHTPSLPETRRLLKAGHFHSLPPGGTFINTARGAVVDEEGLIQVLRARPDLTALLDVTEPEPPLPDSPLYTLPNVFLTPHIAGSTGTECQRMGQYMVEELDRFLAGEPLRYRITRQQAEIMA